MKPNRAYVAGDAAFPFMGLDTLVPSTQLDPRYSPKVQNVEIQKGIIGKRRGYQAMGSGLTDPVIGVVEFETLSGSKILLAFTTKKQYKWDGSAWVNITYQSASVDVNWSGTESDWLSYSFVAGLDSTGSAYKKWIIISNGVNPPRYWDGSMSKFALYSTAAVLSGGAGMVYSGFVTARAIEQFYDHVVMANVTTGSQDENAVAWSAPGSLTDFGATGSSIDLLPNTRGQILRLIPIGDRMAIYCENSIHTIAYVGGAQEFSFERVVDESRLVSGRTIVNLGPYHIFLSEENVVAFDGTKYFRPLGDRIYREYRDELYVSGRDKAFAFHDPARQHIYFSIPTGATTASFYRLEYDLYNLDNSRWTRLTYGHRPASMGLFSRDASLSWSGLKTKGLTWSEMNIPWNRGTLRNAFPIRVFGDTAGQVFLDDEIVAKDSTLAIDTIYDSKDFTVPTGFISTFGRWFEIELDLKGFECDIYVSTDQGSTYEFVEKLELTSQWVKYKIPVDYHSATFRLSLRNSCINSKFECRFMRVWLVEGGPA